MAKIRMRSPDDGKVYEFDGKYGPEYRQKGWEPVLTPVQTAARGVSKMLPPLVGAVGGAAGLAAGGGLTAGVGALPGAAVGATAGGAMGAMGGRALESMAGLEPERGPLGVAADAAQQGIDQTLGFGMGAVGQRGMRAAAAPLMRQALHPKRLGPQDQFIEELALKHGVPVTHESYRFLKRIADTYVRGVGRAIAAETANPNGTRFSWNSLRGALASARANAAANDPISMATERALQQAQNVLKYKFEGREAMTPAQMQEIKRFAQEKAKALYKARMELKDPKVGAEESAYKLVAAEAQKLLEQIPLVAKRNRAASEAISVQKAVMEALMRKPPQLIPGMIGAGSAALHGGSLMDPASLALGGAGFLGAQAAMSPTALSRLALWANSPMAQQAVGGALGQVPRVGSAAWGGVSGQPPVQSLLETLGVGRQPEEPLP